MTPFSNYRLALLVLLLLGSEIARSEGLGAYLEREITQYEGALDKLPESEVSNPTADLCLKKTEPLNDWRFERFFLRLRPRVTFTAGIAKIAIVPDIEMYWERDRSAP